MIRRFTSAQFVPANAGAKAKNPVGSPLFSTPMVALLRHPGHKIIRTSCHESARKRLITKLKDPLNRVWRQLAVLRESRTDITEAGSAAAAIREKERNSQETALTTSIGPSVGSAKPARFAIIPAR